MLMGQGYARSITAFLGILLCCALVLSFGLHTVELTHIHPGGHTHHSGDPIADVLSDYMHGSEKKSFMFVLASFLLSALFVAVYVQNFNTEVVATLRSFARLKAYTRQRHITSYFHLLFSRGILNTKRY